MDKICDIECKAKSFEEMVVSSFDFLETEFEMHRGDLRISNRNDPREVTIKIRFESTTHRFDITWEIGQNGIGILIWNKKCLERHTVYNKNCFTYFEPFLEFLTNGKEKSIVPQVYPKMSMNKLVKVMEQRKQLFESPLTNIIDRLAIKLKANYKVIISKDIASFKEFHKWMDEHR